MKSVGVCLLFALVAAQTALSQQRKTDRERGGLSGEVYAVSTMYKSRGRDSGAQAPQFHQTEYYDRSGNRTLELDYWGDRMATRKTFRHNGPDEIIETIEDGGWEGRGGTDGPTPPAPRVIKHSLKYSVDGTLSEESLLTQDGKLLEKTEYRYDRQRRLIESKTNPTHYATFKYGDGDQPVSSTTQLGAQPSFEQRFSYELDAKGNWTKRSAEGATPRTERTISYYSSETGEGAAIPGESPTDPLRPMPADFPIVIRKSGGVLQQTATRRVKPPYPPEAAAAHVTGSVVVELRIDHYGNVSDAKALSGPPELQDAAVTAAKQWKFPPTRLSGQPADVVGTITFNFQM
jgi:TonB family protein